MTLATISVHLGGTWWKGTYGLCYIVDYHRTIRIPVVHRSERLVPFLAGCIPYLELDSCCVV